MDCATGTSEAILSYRLRSSNYRPLTIVTLPEDSAPADELFVKLDIWAERAGGVEADEGMIPPLPMFLAALLLIVHHCGIDDRLSAGEKRVENRGRKLVANGVNRRIRPGSGTAPSRVNGSRQRSRFVKSATVVPGAGGCRIGDQDPVLVRGFPRVLPGLTLDRTVRLLEAALGEPEMKLPRAVALVDYHIRRNRVAKASHDKTWKERHKGVNYLRL